MQRAGLTTAPWSADDGIHPIFDEFLRKLGDEYKQLTRMPDGTQNPRFAWLPATGYADDLEFKDSWHFVNSDENRARLASYWTATLFSLDVAWNVWRV